MAKRILVVDDEEGIRQTLSFVLEDEGYEIVTASNGSEALTNLSADSFDVVITDLRMPAPDGMEILRKVKGPIVLPMSISHARLRNSSISSYLH